MSVFSGLPRPVRAHVQERSFAHATNVLRDASTTRLEVAIRLLQFELKIREDADKNKKEG